MLGLMASVTVGEVTDAAGLEALRAEWAELWDRCPTASPFVSPEWLLPWWRCFGGAGLCVRTLRDGGRLVGLAPLFVWNDPASRERTVLLLGTGISDLGGALFAPEWQSEGPPAVLEHLAHAGGHDAWDFQQLREGSLLLDVSSPAGWQSRTVPQEVCPVLPLPAGVERIDEIVPDEQMKKLRYYRRRAIRLGTLSAERASEATFPELFAALLRLHAARWSAAGERGVLADGAVQRFHREAAAGLLQRGVLRLYGLRIDGRLAACYYGFLAKGQACFYLAGFDPEFSALSPGMLVVGHAIEEAVREGAVEFDFLRGAESYKYRWGATDRHNYRRCLRPAGPR